MAEKVFNLKENYPVYKVVDAYIRVGYNNYIREISG